MANHDDTKDVFREFLSDFNDEYPGTDFRFLRFLLYDHLTISLLAREDISGFALFNQLHSQGDISYDNVSILYEIAELTKKNSAVDLIKEFREEIPHNATKEYKRLTPYRRALFRALEHVTPKDVPKVRTFYELDTSEYNNIWDVVFHLEIQGRLDDNKKKVQRFLKRLNKKAGDILTDFLEAKKTEPITSVKSSTGLQPSTKEGDQKSASKEMSNKDFNILLNKLSRWYDGKKYTSMLKMLFSDAISGAGGCSTTNDLFQAVMTVGKLSQKNIQILVDMVKVTNTFGVLNSVEALSASCDDTPAELFTPYRKMLIQLGNDLSQKESETLGNLYEIPLPDYNSDQWILIMELERKGVISEDNMQSFINDLKEVDLGHAARGLEKAITN